MYCKGSKKCAERSYSREMFFVTFPYRTMVIKLPDSGNHVTMLW